MAVTNLKKQERITIYAYTGYPIVITKHSDKRNINMFRKYLNQRSKGL